MLSGHRVPLKNVLNSDLASKKDLELAKAQINASTAKWVIGVGLTFFVANLAATFSMLQFFFG